MKVSLGNDRKRVVDLLFFVVKGPNNLLGRVALEKLWPKLYSSLSNAACLTRVPSNDMSSSMRTVDPCAARGVSARGSAAGDKVAQARPATAAAADTAIQRPEPQTEYTNLKKCSIPPPPTGEITQEIGEKYLRLICDTYPEVFDGEPGYFRGSWATMNVKPGHE